MQHHTTMIVTDRELEENNTSKDKQRNPALECRPLLAWCATPSIFLNEWQFSFAGETDRGRKASE